MAQKTRRRLIVTLLIGIAVSAGLTAMLLNGYLRPVQLQASDFLYRLKPGAQARWVTLIAIDDRSIAALRDQGRVFSWPRDIHARVIDNLKAAGARIIAMDVLFEEPAPGDEALAASIEQAGNVVLAEAGEVSLPPTPGHPNRYAELHQQLPALHNAALAIGHANANPDTDGTIRSMPLVVDAGGEVLPSLSLAAAAKFLRRPAIIESPIVAGRMSFAGRQIPVDSQDRLWISYLADSSEVTDPPTFPVVSYIDALNNRFSPDLVRGKLALIGITGTAYADDFWTPVSRYAKMDGVEVHANAIETILRPDLFILPAGSDTTIAYIIFAGLVAAVALGFLPPLPSLGVGLLASAIYCVAAVRLIDTVVNTGSFIDGLLPRTGIILDLPYPLLSLWLSYLLILFYRIVFEQAEQRALKGALSQYLSPHVMEEVVRAPEALKLGGEKREMTVLFSDIRGFTSISEELEPERLVHLLNVYLTRMTDVIFKHQGTVDKYMGDAVMAFWGAPQLQPDHARLACLAALEMVNELELLRREFERDGLPPMYMGVGLNTGPMSVGNMGSSRRFDYTVMGDAVNLGSRLEGLNKEYGTSIILSEQTLRHAGTGFRARLLDRVSVKGKRASVTIYELLGSGSSPNGASTELLEGFDRGIERYRASDFSGALAAFESCVALAPDDGPSKLYVARCRDLLETPPPADWDGVFIMAHK
ncbi:MAG: adenylate/guanylate cyclase domain-containing protein [Chloroflexi bacterium]|nr:adenylate/guanylate cyclase domain-containing protein [Chloroflexota bacterium]